MEVASHHSQLWCPAQKSVYCSVLWAHFHGHTTDAHGYAPGLGLPGELVERGLDCGGKAVMG